MMPKSAGGRNN